MTWFDTAGNPPPHDEVCPNCGDWVPTLIENTGWCPTCSGHKTCRRCGTTHPLTEYRTDRRQPDGHRGICSPCLRQAEHAHRQANLDHARQHDRQKMRRYRAHKRETTPRAALTEQETTDGA